jgi:hypothetical protein
MLYMFQFYQFYQRLPVLPPLHWLALGCGVSLREKGKKRARSLKSLILGSLVIPALRHLVAVVQTGFECLPGKAIQSSQPVLVGRGTTRRVGRIALSHRFHLPRMP